MGSNKELATTPYPSYLDTAQLDPTPIEKSRLTIRRFLELTKQNIADMQESISPRYELAVRMLGLVDSLQFLLDTHEEHTGEEVITNRLEIVSAEPPKATTYSLRCFREIDDAVGLSCEIDPENYRNKDAPRGSIMRVFVPSVLMLEEVIEDARRPSFFGPPDTSAIRAVEPDVWSNDVPRNEPEWRQEEAGGKAEGSREDSKSLELVFWPDKVVYKPFESPEEIGGYVKVLQRLLCMLPDQYR